MVGGMLLIVAGAWGMRAEAAEAAQAAPARHPMARVARMFNSPLPEGEARIEELTQELAGFVRFLPHPLNTGRGYRGRRSHVGGADPSITLDLGSKLPVEATYLIPDQQDFFNEAESFSKCFGLELSEQGDFVPLRSRLTTRHSLP